MAKLWLTIFIKMVFVLVSNIRSIVGSISTKRYLMAVWRFPEINTILNVSYNYQDQRVIERLNWGLSSITK